MDQAKQYLARYQQAETVNQKQAIVEEYQKFLTTLTEAERDQAREVMGVLWSSIKKHVDELEPMMGTLESMVNQLANGQLTRTDKVGLI